MGRAALIIVMGSILILGVLNMNTVNKLSSATQNSVDYHDQIGARNICNSMVELILAKLANDKNYRVLQPATQEFFDGTVTYTVVEVTSLDSPGDEAESVDDSGEGDHSEDDHSEDDHSEDDHGEDDHGGDDHGGDDHGDEDHSLNMKNSDTPGSPITITNKTAYAGFSFFNLNIKSLFPSENAFDFSGNVNDASVNNYLFVRDDDDHEEDDHEEDDHEDEDHGEEDHGGEDHGGEEDGGGGDSGTAAAPKAEAVIIKISVSASVSNAKQTATVFVSLPTGGYVPTAVLSAVTTNSPIVTNGNLSIDGRNHKMDGTLRVGIGTYGIWTTSTLSQQGSSDIGGTDSTSDFAPTKPANASIIKTSQTWVGGSYPDSPDKVLGGTSQGFPEGTLKAFAQNPSNVGSQYVTSPASLSYPLQGVTYVELSSGSTWNSANITGTGILIVHNSSTNAIIKNINSGPFKGLVIADDIIRLHTNILGAVFVLSSSPSEGNCLGNGSGSVIYSSQAVASGVEDAGGVVKDVIKYGFGKHRLKILAWYE